MRASGTVWSDVFRNPDLRRLELGRVSSVTAEASAAVALGVYAFTRSGALAVALIVTVQMLPGAFTAPWLSATGDRFRRERVLCVCELGRALVVAGMAACAYEGAPVWVVGLLAAALSVVSATFYPARRSLVPLLVGSVRELTSANVVSSTLQSGGLMLGPILAGAVLAANGSDVWPVFAISGFAFLASATGLLRIHNTSRVWVPLDAVAGTSRTAFGLLRTERHLRTVLLTFSIKNVARGAFMVFVVTIPLEMLDLHSAAVGYLSAAVGAGGLLAGVFGGAALLHGRHLGRLMVGGIVLVALAMLLIAGRETVALALIGLGTVGLGNTIADAAGYTLIARGAASDVMARVYGLHESERAVGISAGAIAAALAVDWVGTRSTLIGGGVIALVGAAVLWPGLARVDRETHVPTERLRLLQGSALFANLQSVSLERLAARMQPLTVQAGTSVVRQGEVGESVYVIAAGSLEVVADGRVVATVTDGEYFGEIALLNTTARTATVVARTDARLYVLDGLDFLSAVGGHPVTSAVVRSTADQRLLELARATPRDP
jgi:MFS family permease